MKFYLKYDKILYTVNSAEKSERKTLVNENEKLADAEAEIREVLPEAETQTTTDSQQNIKDGKEDSSAESPKKPAPRRKKASPEKAEEDSAADAAQKPKPKRKSAKKTTEAPAESSNQEALPEEIAEKTVSEEAQKKNPKDDCAEECTENHAESSVTEASDISEEEPADTAAPTEAKDKELSDFEPALVISSEQFAWDLDDADDYADTKFVGERIIPPDELFANRGYPEEETEEFPDTELEETEQMSDESEESYESDENLDGDGQYTLGELELQSEISDKYFAEEEMPEYDPKKPRRIDGRFDLVELFVFTLLAVMIVTTFFFRHTVVDGASMQNTLQEGEHLIISDLFYTPKRGDIIVCEDYTTDIHKPIVKRVIAVAGDHIVVKESGEVFVNGSLLEEDYVFIDGMGMKYDINQIVGEGEIFVMGDHRNVSQDSRAIGTISTDSVLGKVILRFYPFDKFGTVN